MRTTHNQQPEMTECSQTELCFEGPGRRQVTARFHGGQISSDAGGIPLREVEAKSGILSRFAACFRDQRDPAWIEHTALELAGKREPKEQQLASSSTLNRLGLGSAEVSEVERYRKIALDLDAVDRLMVQVLLESYDREPEEIVLDLDATDDRIHGRQEGRFFHGYYDCYCYLPQHGLRRR